MPMKMKYKPRSGGAKLQVDHYIVTSTANQMTPVLQDLMLSSTCPTML